MNNHKHPGMGIEKEYSDQTSHHLFISVNESILVLNTSNHLYRKGEESIKYDILSVCHWL